MFSTFFVRVVLNFLSNYYEEVLSGVMWGSSFFCVQIRYLSRFRSKYYVRVVTYAYGIYSEYVRVLCGTTSCEVERYKGCGQYVNSFYYKLRARYCEYYGACRRVCVVDLGVEGSLFRGVNVYVAIVVKRVGVCIFFLTSFFRAKLSIICSLVRKDIVCVVTSAGLRVLYRGQ